MDREEVVTALQLQNNIEPSLTQLGKILNHREIDWKWGRERGERGEGWSGQREESRGKLYVDCSFTGSSVAEARRTERGILQSIQTALTGKRTNNSFQLPGQPTGTADAKGSCTSSPPFHSSSYFTRYNSPSFLFWSTRPTTFAHMWAKLEGRSEPEKPKPPQVAPANGGTSVRPQTSTSSETLPVPLCASVDGLPHSFAWVLHPFKIWNSCVIPTYIHTHTYIHTLLLLNWAHLFSYICAPKGL